MSWVAITCQEREALIDSIGRSYSGFSRESGVRVLSGLTDSTGEFGVPTVCTTWGYDDGTPVLKDVRWPNPDREAREDAKPCEHYRWAEGR